MFDVLKIDGAYKQYENKIIRKNTIPPTILSKQSLLPKEKLK